MGYLALTGGIGGAKLALGLANRLGPDEITFVVNTGDDFEHLGLYICPDVDTLTYTLAKQSNTKTGWGRQNETWQFMAALEDLGGETWFRLGDRDLGLHVTRTQMLNAGSSLTEATAHIAARFGIRHRILPMSDDPVRTIVHTPDGPLPFQHYFVRDRCVPTVTGFEFQGIDDAKPNPDILERLGECDGIIICPSNPFVSIDPILNLPGFRDALKNCQAPVVAISPIVGGRAIKGPTAKMMTELDIASTASQVAEHYGDLLDGFLLDEQDAALDGTLNVATTVAQSVMLTLQDRVDLADATLQFINTL
ncbi:MAG: 2-phospho-L-lactate transferase [Gammaproteobacteria bacterium]|nr:2-phospho-L-lactate transferase [Gammaproteobacteria bacterium]